MIEAVVFDLDGVIVDSEQVWDDVREEYVRETGGTYTRIGDARHDGHELGRMVALHGGSSWAFPARREEINAEIVRADACPLRRRAAADRRCRRGRAHGGGALAARDRVVVEPGADRGRAARRGAARALSRHRVVAGGRPRQAGAGCVPGGGETARRRAGSVCRGRGLAQRHPVGEGGGHARRRRAQSALPARRGGARSGGCGRPNRSRS